MIWHAVEIWLMLAFVFVAGCALGSLLYLFIAETPLAHPQEVLADTIGDTIDGIKHRFGSGSSSRVRRRVRREVQPEEDYVDYHPAAPPRREAARYQPQPLPPPVEAEAPEPVHAEAGIYDEAYDETLIEQAYPDGDWGEVTAGTEHHHDYPEHPHEHEEAGWEEGHEDLPAPAAPPQAVLPPPEPPPPAEPEPPVVEELPAMRPAGLAAPRNGVPDDLQRIRGIGKKNEELLNSLGIFHFGQIAAWTPAEVRWVGIQIKFPERIERDDWIGQATILASGGRTGYIKAEDRKRVAEEEADRPPGLGPD